MALKPTDPHISCCVCLNRGSRTRATTMVINGDLRYAVCQEHVGLVSRREFDSSQLRKESRTL